MIMIESFHIGDVGNQHNVSRSARFQPVQSVGDTLISAPIGSRIAARKAQDKRDRAYRHRE